ncbi:DNA polymerase III subunit gamma and tau [Nocardioides cynanchi]|uniref:DNA polymerase III subunit gamma and tau n=1 Tax=Nocardioides cynanchi TaxID=2558918 RepID=UPI0012442D71|nr:DNA polymerase III subunit gamma and tau [Nocardioides cynanchi]
MESPLALYRRYRPETFAEVIGQDHVTEPLRAALAANRVNHAYLFSGPRGCGKTTSARILARALNCEQAPVADPCGECDSCQDLARGGSGSIDVIEIDAASHGGVDDARDLREKAFFAPVRSRYKVYIIDEAHMVSTQGFNALLKLVEEPPPHLRFIFATTEPEKVLPTIRSRTHHYPFRLIPPRLLSSYLSELCDKEGVAIEPAALPLVVRAGAGSARDTLSVLDQLMGGAGSAGVTYTLAAGLLGYTPDTLLDEVVDAFSAGDGAAVFGVVDKVIETGQDPRRFAEDLLRRLRDLVIVSAVPDAPATGLIDIAEDAAERLVAQAARFGPAELTRAADLVATGLTEMRGATAPRLLLELICARVLLPGADHSTEGVQARLDRLERRLAITGGEPGQPVRAPVADPPLRVERPVAAAPAPTAPTASVVEESRDHPSEPAAQSAAEPAPPVAEPAPAPATPATSDEQRPGPASAPTAPAASAPMPVSSAEPVATTAAGSPLSLVDVRRLWPDIVEATKQRRRVTWIHLTQQAQVVQVDDTTLTLGFGNAGARDSFLNGGSAEIVRQAAIDVVGHDWRVETIVDPGAQPAAPPPPAAAEPASGPASTPPVADAAAETVTPDPTGTGSEQPPDEPPAWVEPPSASARQAISPTRTAAQGGPETSPADADGGARPDDLDAETSGLDGAQLLQQALGAEVIEEIPHQ